MSMEVDIVIALRVPETPQGVYILKALKKLHSARPDVSGLDELKALPAPAGALFAKAIKEESAQRFRLFDFVARGPQAAFSMVLLADSLDSAFVHLLQGFEAAGCRRIEATAKADELARHYTCADGKVEWTSERGDEGISDDPSDDPVDNE
ncbi:MAG: hypothetical protein ACOY3X_11080 [Pseudomonadota bacterium]